MQSGAKISVFQFLFSRLLDYHQLAKTGLTVSVVLSAVFGFMIASNGSTNPYSVIPLMIGGLLLVASSNSLNQVIERTSDKLMLRTQNRPVAQGRISITEATMFSGITGILGVSLLGLYLNNVSAFLGIASLGIYAFIYTPLKQHTPFAVLIGAIPGAIPPLLGWVAATGDFTFAAGMLFLWQFLWQFPHFWSIAWILEDDYERAGYSLLPYTKTRRTMTVHAIVATTFLMVVASVFPYFIGVSGITSMFVALSSGLYMLFYAFKLYRVQDKPTIKRFMHISIIYNTLVLLTFAIDKI